MNRRILIGSLAAAAGGGALWWNRHWIPTRGVSNPCHAPSLPADLSNHPVVTAALDGLNQDQVWDSHVHLLGVGDQHPDQVWISPLMDDPWHPLLSAQKKLYLNASCPTEMPTTDAGYVDRLHNLVDASPGTRLLLMAFDYHHNVAGQPLPELSTYHVSNSYAQTTAAGHDQLEWICSIHPYREDAIDTLHECAQQGARAVKWLPPAMGMDPSSERCDGFYRAMCDLNMPLLTHGGDELAVQGDGHQHLGNPLLLQRPLETGVRVLVAHCASLGSNEDIRQPEKSRRQDSNFNLFLSMMREPAFKDLLFGEISATTQINRAEQTLQTLLQSEDLHGRLLNGSDYPLVGILPLFSASQLVGLGLLDEPTARVVFKLQGYNPLLFDLVLKRTLRWQGQGFPASIFETARFFDQPATGAVS